MEVVFIHGYSDNWNRIKDDLGDKLLNYNNTLPNGSKINSLNLHYINYKSLEDSATFEDLAEGLYEKLKQNMVVKNLLAEDFNEKISFIVHSTGGLIIRQLLKQYSWTNISNKIDKIIFLAPANFGSPLAHKGKTLLGKAIRGNRSITEDFLEVGKNILNGLELASEKQWELADFDLFGAKDIYGFGKILPFVITGTKPYGGLRKYISEDGTDGTIVVAGAGLNVRKYKIDFTQNNKENEWIDSNSNSDYPALFLKDHDHASIVDNLDDSIKDLIIKMLKLDSEVEYESIKTDINNLNENILDNTNYQQLYFNLKDDRDMPINDYVLEFNILRIKDCVIDVETNSVTNIRGNSIDKHIDKYMDDTELELSNQVDKMLSENAHSNLQNPHLKRFLIIPEVIKSIIGNKYLIAMNIESDTNKNEIFYGNKKTQNIVVMNPSIVVKNPDSRKNIDFFFENTTTLIEIKIDRYTKFVNRYSPENSYGEL